MMKLYSVLLVEDESSTAQLIQHTLERYNFTVKIAENGIVAFRLIRKQKFDLVISDIMMPGMDGISFIQKSLQELANIPIILLTADSSRETVIKARQISISSYMLKPVEPKKLIEKCVELMGLPKDDLLNKKEHPFSASVSLHGSELMITLSGIPTRSIYWGVIETAYPKVGDWQKVGSIAIQVNEKLFYAKKSNDYLQELVIELRKRMTQVKNKNFSIYGDYFKHFQRKEFTAYGEMLKCSIKFPES